MWKKGRKRNRPIILAKLQIIIISTPTRELLVAFNFIDYGFHILLKFY
jgi:hypothetical protein